MICSLRRGAGPARDGPDGRDLRRRGGGVAAVHRGGPLAQAIDAARLPVGVEGASAAGVRRAVAQVHHARAGRRLAPRANGPVEPQQEHALDPAARDLPPGADGLGSSGQPAGPSGEAPDASERRHPGVLARGGLGAGARRSFQAGRRDLPDGCVHRVADGGAVGAPVAGCRLRRRDRPGARELRCRPPDHAEVGKVRAVPMAPDVATELAQVGNRGNWVGDDDLVFAGEGGGHLDGSALRRRYTESSGTSDRGGVQLCPGSPKPWW